MSTSRRVFASALMLATVFSVLLSPQARAELPKEVKLQERSIGGYQYSVSAVGDVFAVLREHDGSAVVALPSGTLDLAAEPAGDFPADAPKHRPRIVINPDGKYVSSFVRGHVVIRSLPDLSLVWRGTLTNNKTPYAGNAFFFRASDKQLVIADKNYLLTYQLADDGTAQRVGLANITFAEKGRTLFGNFVQSGVFTADGKTLYSGTMDGEVLAIDLGGQEPSLRWRVTAMQDYKTPGFNDDAERYAATVACADACKRLTVMSYRDYQVAIVDASKGEVLARRPLATRQRLVGVGGGLFALTTFDRDRSRTELSIVNADLTPVGPTLPTADLLLFGITEGYAAAVSGVDGAWTVAFRSASNAIAEVRRRREAEAAQAQRNEKADALAAEAERKRMAALEKELVSFRRKLKTGDDSNCGLVVERKGDIALVETMIGAKWVKVSQLYVPGMRGCRFANGVLQD